MHSLAHNLRIAFRQLLKSPGFTLTAVLTLALGISGTTAIFSLVESILLRPLPFSDPDHLVLLGDHLGDGASTSVTAREIGTYTKATTAFSSLGGYISATYEISGGPTPEQVNGARFTAGVFPTLGTQPLLGRVFTPEEESSRQPLAVISYALWLNRFNRDPNILGKQIFLDRIAYSIIGVMPRDFEFPLVSGRLDQAQFWIPMSLTSEELSDEHAGFWGYEIVARVKPGIALAASAQDAARVATQIMHGFSPAQSQIQIRGDVTPLAEHDISDVRPLLRTLFLAVSVVLLIACLNVAGLLLVRAIRRRRDYAVRLALGAGAGTILRESVLEGLLVGLAGGLLGLALAAIAIRTTITLLPDSMPRIDSISIDTTVAVFAFCVAMATGALCSLAPAFAALRTNLTESLKESAQTGTGSASHSRLRSSFVIGEIAIALVLLTIAGAFLRSFQKMRAVNPGFRADHLLIAGYRLPLQRYSTENSFDAFNRDVVDRLGRKPGVVSVGIANAVPATGGFGETAFTIEGEPDANWKLKFATFTSTYGEYFRTMRIPLLDGRYFTGDDRSNAPLVVIVNESMAKHCWPGQSAVGMRMHAGGPKEGLPWATVVGVVADIKMGSRDESSDDQWYLPAEQSATLRGPDASAKLTDSASGYIALRTALPPGHMTQTLRAAVAEIDPMLALQDTQTMDEALSAVEAPRRFNTSLITAFALGALLLAITGTYAVVSFSVSLRTQEIAVRMALGAQRTKIAALVLTSFAKLALLGCGLGIVGSIAVSRLVSSFLFEVSPTDPIIYLASVSLMMLMALLASALPAARAASADPVTVLRST